MNDLLIKNSKYLSLDKQLIEGSILITNGKIERIFSSSESLPPVKEVINGNGLYLFPGLIDLQIYGAGGKLFQESPTTDTLEAMSNALLAKGITSFLPGMTSTSIERFQDGIKAVRNFQEERPNNVLGLNIESPLINPDKAGFHDKRFIGRNLEEFINLMKSNPDVLIYLTVAPEVLNKYWADFADTSNVKLSIGHTKSDYSISTELKENGIKLATHLFNGMTGFTGREPGVIGYVLENDYVYTSFIADGTHVNPASFSIAFKILGKEKRLFLISDGMPPIGVEMESFSYENNEISVKDGVCLNQDGVLCGTIVDIFQGLKNVMVWTDSKISDVIDLVTDNPANAIDVGSVGSIGTGKIANLILIDSGQNIIHTILNGKIV